MAGAVQTIRPDQLSGWVAKNVQDVIPRSWEPTLRKCKVAIAADLKRNFAQSRSPDGIPWAKLKIRRGKPLRDRGLLMAAATANGPGHVERISDVELVYGVNLEYASLHQYGGIIRPKKGRFLAIPLTREARRVAGPRSFPRRLVALIRGSSGVLAETQKRRDGRVVVAQFALVESVTVPARPFIGLSPRVVELLLTIIADDSTGLRNASQPGG